MPRYPDSAEREFKRITNAYLRVLNEELKKELPGLMKELKRERENESRHDDSADFERRVREKFLKIAQRFEQREGNFGLAKRIEAIGKQTKNTSLREWKRAVKNTLGIDLFDGYYGDDFYERQITNWVGENAQMIKSIPSDAMREMQDIVLNGYREGKLLRDIQNEIQDAYGVNKRKAQMLARDQIATLNAQIAQAQQRDAGIQRYRWSTSHDARVRDCHKALDGKVFSWDSPPEMWYETKKNGKVMTGRRCHPGCDFACRCVAIPIFDIDTLNIPIKGDNGNE